MDNFQQRIQLLIIDMAVRLYLMLLVYPQRSFTACVLALIPPVKT